MIHTRAISNCSKWEGFEKKMKKRLWDPTYMEMELILRKGLCITDVGKVSLLFQLSVLPVHKVEIRLFP